MSLKAQTDLWQAEIVSYRKCFAALETAYSAIAKGKYGEVDGRALEAIRLQLDSVRNIALRYDILLGRIRKEEPENRASTT